MSGQAEFFRAWFSELRGVRAPQLAVEEKALLGEIEGLEKQRSANERLRHSHELESVAAEVGALKDERTKLHEHLRQHQRDVVRIMEGIVQKASAGDDYELLCEVDAWIRKRGSKTSLFSMSASELRYKLPEFVAAQRWRQELTDRFQRVQIELGEISSSDNAVVELVRKKNALSTQVSDLRAQLQTMHDVSNEVLDALVDMSGEQARSFVSEFLAPTLERAERESAWKLPARVVSEEPE